MLQQVRRSMGYGKSAYIIGGESIRWKLYVIPFGI